MQLRRAVCAGRYSPLPSSYSPQLSRILSQMLVVEPSRRLRALDIVEHEEVRKRRASHELAHPAALPEEADDLELLATIKPPKSKYEVMQLSEKLSAMSAQVATARSDASARGEPSNVPQRLALKTPALGSLVEDGPASALPVFESQLPPARFGGYNPEPAPVSVQPFIPQPSYPSAQPAYPSSQPAYPVAAYPSSQPAYAAAAAQPRAPVREPAFQPRVEEEALPAGWKKVV